MSGARVACLQCRRAPCRGVVLPLALAYLVVIALVGGLLVEAAALQFRMAGNHEARTVAELDARALAHELTGEVRLSLQLPPQYRVCGGTGGHHTCDERTLARPGLVEVTGRSDAAYSIARLAPGSLGMMVGREPQSRASSAAHDRFALYEVDVSVPASDGRPGSARVVRGIALRLPSGPGQ